MNDVINQLRQKLRGKRLRVISKPIRYPKPHEVQFKTFHIKYEEKLSSIGKLILKSFRAKYIYYAIDDILYLLRTNPIERDKLLKMLYSIIIALQNNLYVNYFDIWICEIYINELLKFNKFIDISRESKNLEDVTYITITVGYKKSLPVEKPDLPW